MDTEAPSLGGFRSTELNLPTGWAYPISYRKYDLYRPTTGTALELKVGYTTASSAILAQIGFDVALLRSKANGFTNTDGANPGVSGIIFQDYPGRLPVITV